ncbi:MAG TPA: sugar ABC transporter permease [Thermomicrobiales bacterium]
MRSLLSSVRRSGYGIGLGLLLSPYLLGVTILIVLPAVFAFVFAFARYDALTPPVWIGFENFRAVFRDPIFRIAVRNSFLFVLLAVPLRLFGALTLALLLSRQRRGVGLYRAAVYLPTIIPDVPYALLWLWIFNPIYGPLNAILGALGLPTPAWLVNPDTALLAIVLMSAFQLGEGFVVLLAGLQDIPGDLYDAAAIDGGGPWRVFRTITLPLLAPWLLLNTLRDIMLSAQGTFTPAFIMTGGDPYYATLFLPLHIYNVAFGSLRFGQATAMMLLLLLGVALLLLLVYYLLGGWGYDDDL